MGKVFTLLVCFFISGLLLADKLSMLLSRQVVFFCLLFMIIMFLFCIFFFKNTRMFYVLVCVMFLMLGVIRMGLTIMPTQYNIDNYVDKEDEYITVFGQVASYPEKSKKSRETKTRFLFNIEAVLKDSDLEIAKDTVQVKLFNKAQKDLFYGDELIVKGRVSFPERNKNPVGFDYKRYLNRKGIKVLMSSSEANNVIELGEKKTLKNVIIRMIYKIRSSSQEKINRYFRGPISTIVKSTILGVREGVDNSDRDIFIKTGTMHILAISGLHLGIVTLLIYGILSFLNIPQKIKIILVILSIIIFTVFTGMRASTMRAAIMGAMFLVGSGFFGRRVSALNIMGFAAFLILYFMPGEVFSPGFILSFSAVFSIFYITPIFDGLFFGTGKNTRNTLLNRINYYILKSLSVSFSVFIGTMPFTAMFFNTIPVSSILANLFAVPVLFAIVILGYGFLVVASFCSLSGLAIFVADLIKILLVGFTSILQKISFLPFSCFRVARPQVYFIVLFYLILFIVIFSPYFKKRIVRLIVISLLALNCVIWNENICYATPSIFSVLFFDVGKADASVLEFSDGSTILIDGGRGASENSVDAGREVLAPYLWQKGIRKIDCIILTHAHEDHLGGLFYIIKNFEIGAVVDQRFNSECEGVSPAYGSFKEIIEKRNIKYLIVKRADIIRGFPGMEFLVLNPGEKVLYKNINNYSIVIRAVSSDGNSMLFCADVEAEAMKDLLRYSDVLGANVVKLPHHGGAKSSIPILKHILNVAQPDILIITNKKFNYKQDLIDGFSGGKNCKIFITGENGAISCESLKNKLKIEHF